MALAALDLFARVITPGTAAFRGFHRLAVDHAELRVLDGRTALLPIDPRHDEIGALATMPDPEPEARQHLVPQLDLTPGRWLPLNVPVGEFDLHDSLIGNNR